MLTTALQANPSGLMFSPSFHRAFLTIVYAHMKHGNDDVGEDIIKKVVDIVAYSGGAEATRETLTYACRCLKLFVSSKEQAERLIDLMDYYLPGKIASIIVYMACNTNIEEGKATSREARDLLSRLTGRLEG